MPRWVRAGALVLSLLAPAWPASGGTLTVTPPRPVDAGDWAEPTELPSLASSPDGRRWVAYFNAERKLRFRGLDGGQAHTLYVNPPGPNLPSRSALLWEGERAHVLMRPKLSANKSVEVMTSTDGGATFKAPVRISQGRGALLPIHFRGDGKLLVALWVDERRSPRIYDYYLNLSVDGGETFLPQDVKMSDGYLVGSSSTLLVRGHEIFAFFMGVKDKASFIVLRRSPDLGKTWQEQRIAQFPEEEYGGSMAALATPDRVYIFWASGLAGVRGASTADGRSWTAVAEPEETKGLDIGGLEAAAGPSGEITVTFFARRVPGARPKIYALYSPNRGARWLPLRQLNTNPHADLTKAQSTQLASDGKGTLVVVWQDHRDIRGTPYLNYSRDYGLTWAVQDTVIGEPGAFNSIFPQILRGTDDRYTVVFFRYEDDRRVRGQYYVTEVTLPPGPPPTSAPPPSLVEMQFRASALRTRVEDFWKGMMASDWSRLYDFYDPFFRTKETRNKFVGGRGGIIYHSAEIVRISQQGNLADVRVKVDLEAPDAEFMGLKNKGIPRQNRVLEERWLWVDQNWFREFRNSVTQEGLAPY